MHTSSYKGSSTDRTKHRAKDLSNEEFHRDLPRGTAADPKPDNLLDAMPDSEHDCR